MIRSLVAILLIKHADAHGRLTVPQPRAPLWRSTSMQGFTSPSSTYREEEPAFYLSGAPLTSGHQYTSTSGRCHDFAPAAPDLTLRAGSALHLEWHLSANHPGDCAVYISYDEPSVPHPGQSHWAVLARFPGCADQSLSGTDFDGRQPPNDNAWTVTLPAWLPTASHAVLRWEWVAVHNPDVQFFVSC